MTAEQNYGNYHQHYYQTPAGRLSKQRSQRKYRQKLAQKWGVSQLKAAQLEAKEKGAKA